MAADVPRAAVVQELLDRHGQTYADEIGLDPAKPAGLFGLLVFALLASTRIRASLAVAGTRALLDAGWTTAEKMRASTWEQRARTLNESGYARYDERTASQLGEACALLLDRYDGDLRQLRSAAEQDPAREKELLQEVKGIGPTGADVFLREAQAAWPELRPYVDQRARDAAMELGLPTKEADLAGLVDEADLPRLVAALLRTRLDKDADEVLESAGSGSGSGARSGSGAGSGSDGS
jgi:endonuclease III